MGLDQYAQTIKREYPDPKQSVCTRTLLVDWRKHNRLQGYMTDLFYKKGYTGEFNCRDLPLYEDDIDELEKVIKNQELPYTTGFFFGDDSYIDYIDEDGETQYSYVRDELPNDLQFIIDARKALEEGYDVVYRCSW
jgi:hypothetical protein